MQSLNNNERKEVLGEVLADEQKAIHELVKDVPVIKEDVKLLRQNAEELKPPLQI